MDNSAVDSRASRAWRRSLRASKAAIDPWRPVALLVEEELSRQRRWESVQTLFLANRECPFHCTMCDLWKQTLDEPTPVGAIPAQIRWAQEQLRAASHIKLYNAGNFFDPLAIPPADYREILQLTESYETVIVENHPRLCGRRALEFAKSCSGRLEVALGLETIEPQTLELLDKQLTVDGFDRAVEQLLSAGASVRAFVILQLPGLQGDRAVDWTVRSIQHAWQRGVDCVSVIPARAGDGWMRLLSEQGDFQPPTLAQLTQVVAECATPAAPLDKPRLQVDFWDIDRLEPGNCEPRETLRRLAFFNRNQRWEATTAGVESDEG